jgi:hypothetical protein
VSLVLIVDNVSRPDSPKLLNTSLLERIF